MSIGTKVLTALLLLICLASAQTNIGGGGTSGTANAAIITSGLIAEYRMTDGGTTTLLDSSGAGNNGTFPGGGNNPVPVAGTGGYTFTQASNQRVSLPAALNSTVTFVLVTNFTLQTSNTYYAPVLGTTNPCFGIFYSTNLVTDGSSNSSGAAQIVSGWSNALGQKPSFFAAPLGTHVITYVQDASLDKLAFDNNLNGTILNGQAAGNLNVQSAGNYLLGGGNSTCPGGARNTNAFTGTIYYAAFYNRALSDGEILQNYAAITQIMQNRGLAGQNGLPSSYAGPRDSIMFVGDSEVASIATAGATLGGPAGNITLPSGMASSNLGLSGTTPEALLAALPTMVFPVIPIQSGRMAVVHWSGTNDQAGSATTTYQNVAANCRQIKSRVDVKCLVGTMMSRTGSDTFKNNLNAPLRLNWVGFGDGICDIASDPNLGADGASANTTYFPDGLHLTAFAAYNALGPVINRCIAEAYGNLDWTTATTYTTSAAAATATTAGSEATNTVTTTFGATPANCNTGNMITFAGITPAGYNGTFQVLAPRTGTQITTFNSNTGLGPITVQGTGVCPQQQDVDVFSNLGGSAAGNPSFTMTSCVGITGQNRYFKNSNTTSAWVLTPFVNTETIDGATSLTMPTASSGNFPVIILQSQLISAAAGGCTWKRLQ